MKKVIKQLEQAKAYISAVSKDCDVVGFFACEDAIGLINNTIAELQSPRWYTPEQWEKHTGERWPERAAVYYLSYRYSKWYVSDWGLLQEMRFDLGDTTQHNAKFAPLRAVCATEAGPPPDDWKPEEAQ
jgi:hypothetical protein